MKLKSIATAVCASLATLSVATGIIITAGANGGESASPTNVTSVDNAAYFTNKEDSVVEYGQDNNSSKMGVKATLVLDDKLTFRNVIDLQEMYEKGESFLEILPIVETVGVAEYKRITIEVIDVYDETNFIKIQLNAEPQQEDKSTIGYFLACASNGQRLTGYESGADKLHVNDEYGEWSVFSFGDVIDQSSGTGFFYDVEKNSICAVDYRGVRKQIIDFDDPAYFGTYLWSGFSSNEVYCRIKCDDYKKDKASILVSKYGDYDLRNDKIYDVVAPKLSVDYGKYEKDSIPSALVNTPYRIFPASTFDSVDGVMQTDVKVYTNYYSSQPIAVKVGNGTFTPKWAVPHYIVYSAADVHGNESKEVVPVRVLTECEELTLSFDEIVTTCVEGDTYMLPSYQVNGALGIADVNVSCLLNGERLAIVNDQVRPYTSGTMKISYKAVDYVGRTYETEQIITVTEAEKPTFIETPILPKYFIQGNTYTLPKLNAYNYVTGNGEAISTKVYVKENGTERLLSDYVYEVGEVAQTEIIYKATVGSAENEYAVIRPVYSVRNDGDLDMSKYFLFGANGATATTEDGVNITATANECFEYLNYVTAISLKAEFTLTDSYKNFEKLNIYLTDINNESRVIKFTYAFDGAIAKFYVNDNSKSAVEVSGELEEEKRFLLTFEADSNKVYYDITNNNILPVYNYLNGEKFEGFTNSKAYVKFELEGVKDTATVSINSLNSNYFSDETQDWIMPLIDFRGNVGGEYKLGDVITLPEVIANDVLAGDVNAYITMTAPDGTVMSTVNGIRLENLFYDGSLLQVKLTQYGSYVFSVNARDAEWNEAFLSVVVWVSDTEVPVLTLSGSIVTEANVGDKINVPKASCTDNLSQTTVVKVYVVMPGACMVEIGKNDGFVAEKAGVYTVIYYAYDEAGNFVSQKYNIKVS